jgi:hypothetical protein
LIGLTCREKLTCRPKSDYDIQNVHLKRTSPMDI